MSESRHIYIAGQRVPVSEEFYKEYHKLLRKEKYFSEDLKTERFLYNPEKQTVNFLPSREDSYERLLEQDKQFSSDAESVEDAVIRSLLLEKLYQALQTLSTDEMSLIYEIFYLRRTEREISDRLHVPSTTLHSRKNAILRKLRKLVEKF